MYKLFFYRKRGTDEIIVKFMLNEKETTIPIKSEIAPFYFWKDVEKFYRDYIGYLYRDIKK